MNYMPPVNDHYNPMTDPINTPNLNNSFGNPNHFSNALANSNSNLNTSNSVYNKNFNNKNNNQLRNFNMNSSNNNNKFTTGANSNKLG